MVRWIRIRIAAALLWGFGHVMLDADEWELQRIPEAPHDIDMSRFDRSEG